MESPGTAPGSEPRITGAFIAIFPVARNRFNIGVGWGLCKQFGICVLRAFYVLFTCFIRAYDNQRIRRIKKARAKLLRGPFGRVGFRLTPT